MAASPLFPWMASLASLVLTWLAVAGALRLAVRSGMLAQPGPRASHRLPTPTGGGIGIVAGLCLLALLPALRQALPSFWLVAVVPGLALLGGVGWADDRRELSAVLRLLVQLAVSAWLLVCLEHWATRGATSPGLIDHPVAFAFWWLALTWVMNAYNFMDGSDGLAAGQGVFAACLLALLFILAGAPALALAACLVAAACLGLLPWNLPPARVFMGDAGSVPLGYALGALLLAGVLGGYLGLPVAILVLAPFLIDATLTLLTRALRGERWYNPHNSHVYQRLITAGWSHGRVLALYQAINIIIVVPGVGLGTMYSKLAWPLTGLTLLVLVAGWCAASLKWPMET